MSQVRRDAPHDPRAEEALLGAMLLARQPIEEASTRLRPADFYQPAHVHIYDAILALYEAGVKVDPITVADSLDRAGVLDACGGAGALVALQADTPALSNVARYALIVEHSAVCRRMIGAAGEIAEVGYARPEDPYKALDFAQQMLLDIRGDRGAGSLRGVREMLVETVDRLERLYESGAALTGIPTGFLDFDELTSGLQPGAVTIIAGRPGMGKTAMALNIATHATIRDGRTFLFHELEGSHQEVTGRLLASEARIDSTRIRNGKLVPRDWDRVTEAVDRLAGADLWVDDSASVSVLDIRAQARRLQFQRGRLDCVVVDHVGLVGDDSVKEYERVTATSRGLKVLAKDLNCHVIALAQLNRGVEQRSDKRPTMADLRSSGSLEQDADTVVFLYRDEVYDRQSPDLGVAEVIVAKQRDGPTGLLRLAYLGQYTRFANMARQ